MGILMNPHETSTEIDDDMFFALRLWKGSLGVAVTWERLFSKHLGSAAAVDDVQTLI